MRHLLMLIATAVLVSCDPASAKSPPELRDEIHAAAAEAKECVAKEDAPAAEAAAARATAALARLRELNAQAAAAQPSSAPLDAALLAECEAKARQAGQWATLTKEKVARAEKLAGWRAKIYHTVQSATLRVFIHTLALAADQAAAGNLKLLPQSIQDGAAEAAKFIESYVGPRRLASGELDWQGVGRELRKFAEAPPLDLRFLVVVMLMAGLDFDSAFYEVEAIPEALCKTPEEQICYRLLRGAACLGQGYGELALAEFELADKLSTDHKLNMGTETKCGMHLGLALYFLHEKRWADADRCLASANRAWPDNPVVVYLTGERQVAANNYTAADDSFAKALKGTDYEWLAERVAVRMKRLRDSPASLEPVLFDFHLMTDLAWAFVKNESKKSAAMKSLQDRMEATQAFVQELKQKLPDMEMKMPGLKDLWKRETAPAGSKK